jgi:hypothetical protein
MTMEDAQDVDVDSTVARIRATIHAAMPVVVRPWALAYLGSAKPGAPLAVRRHS